MHVANQRIFKATKTKFTVSAISGQDRKFHTFGVI